MNSQHMINEEKNWKTMFKIGVIAAFAQLACIAAYYIGSIAFGDMPGNVKEIFEMMNAGGAEIFFKGDFITLILLALYLVVFYCLYGVLKKQNKVFAAFYVLLTFIAVILYFKNHNGFSMIFLNNSYNNAATAVDRNMILAAGEAVIAGDVWNSSAAYISGILLQGSGVLISILMLKSKQFSLITVIAGIAANGLDLFQHVIHHELPEVTSVILLAAGPFYLLWYTFLGLNLLRLSRKDGTNE